MAQPTNPPQSFNPVDQLTLQFVAQQDDYAIVRIGSQNYRLTVSKYSDETGWTNITGTRDWTTIASQAAEIFFAQQPERKIDTGTVILSGDLQDIETDARQRNVRLVSATHRAGAQEKTIQASDLVDSSLNITPEQKAVITQTLSNLGQELAHIRPASFVHPRSFQEDIQEENPYLARKDIAAMTAIPTKQIDATGRCLDRSLAHLILSKNGKIPVDTRERDQLADRLREEASAKIQDECLTDEPLFFQYLRASISNIPAFSDEPYYFNDPEGKGQALKTHSKEKLENFFGKECVQQISVILEKFYFHDTSAEERQILQNFYGKYIVNKDEYLDLAFLYVFPTLPSANGAKCAVIQNDRITARFPSDNPEELSLNDWLFVAFDSPNRHYDIVNMEIGRDYLQKIIEKEKQSIKQEKEREKQNSLINFLQNPSLENAIHLENKDPQAFQALCHLVYDQDHEKWMLDQQGVEPGTREIEHQLITYEASPKGYGMWKLYTYPDEFITITIPQIQQKISELSL